MSELKGGREGGRELGEGEGGQEGAGVEVGLRQGAAAAAQETSTPRAVDPISETGETADLCFAGHEISRNLAPTRRNGLYPCRLHQPALSPLVGLRTRTPCALS